MLLLHRDCGGEMDERRICRTCGKPIELRRRRARARARRREDARRGVSAAPPRARPGARGGCARGAAGRLGGAARDRAGGGRARGTRVRIPAGGRSWCPWLGGVGLRRRGAAGWRPSARCWTARWPATSRCLGICFGGQHLARALGATVGPASRPEVGWLEVETLAARVVPPGRWLQWHRDAFTPRPAPSCWPGRRSASRPSGSAAPRRAVPPRGRRRDRAWAGRHDYPESLARAGTDVDAARAGGEAHAAGAGCGPSRCLTRSWPARARHPACRLALRG